MISLYRLLEYYSKGITPIYAPKKKTKKKTKEKRRDVKRRQSAGNQQVKLTFRVLVGSIEKKKQKKKKGKEENKKGKKTRGEVDE